MPSPCHLFQLNEDIYLLNADGVMNKLVEESLPAKLDILMAKELFDLAIRFAIFKKVNKKSAKFLALFDEIAGRQRQFPRLMAPPNIPLNALEFT